MHTHQHTHLLSHPPTHLQAGTHTRRRPHTTTPTQAHKNPKNTPPPTHTHTQTHTQPRPHTPDRDAHTHPQKPTQKCIHTHTGMHTLSQPSSQQDTTRELSKSTFFINTIITNLGTQTLQQR